MIIKSGKLCKITNGTNNKTYAYTRTQTSDTTATQGSLEIESTVTQNSSNLITSGGVYNYLQSNGLFETDEVINSSGLVKLVDGKVCKLSSTVNDATVFENATSDYINVCQIDTDKYIVLYSDAGNSNYLTGCVLTVSNNIVSAGTPVVIDTVSSDSKHCTVKLNTDKALVCYKGSSLNIYGVVLTVSGTVITVNTPTLIRNTGYTNPSFIKCIQLETDKVLLFYKMTSSFMRTITISNTTITANAEVTIVNPYGMSNDFTNLEVCKLTSSSFAIAVYDNSLYELYTTKGVISGNTPSINYLCYTNFIQRAGCEFMLAINDTSYLLLATYSGVFGAVIDISGFQTVVKSYFAINDVVIDLSISKLSDNRFLLNYVDQTGSYGKSRVLTWDGTNLLIGDPVNFNAQTTAYISSDTTSLDYSLVVYKDTTGYGTARTISVDRATGYVISNYVNKQNITGISTNVNVIPYISFT